MARTRKPAPDEAAPAQPQAPAGGVVTPAGDPPRAAAPAAKAPRQATKARKKTARPAPATPRPKKAAAPRAARKGAAPAALAGPVPPASPWDAPLEELSRDALSAFVYVALLPDQTLEAVKQLGLSLPGFRREALGDVQRADLLADEIRADPGARAAVLGPLRADFREPPFAHLGLDAQGAAEALALLDHEDAEPLTLWRVLCDPAPAVREVGARYLDDLAKALYGKQGEAKAPRGGPTAEDRLADAERKLLAAREERESLKKEHEARLESQRRKAEEQREKLQEWLKEARARESAARDEAARAREAAETARRSEERLAAALAAAKAEDQAQELQRARAELRDAEGRATSLDARLERARERERELEAELERARASSPAPVPASAAAVGEGGDEPEEVPSTWLFPVYTREFYDSLEGWDRRIQRAAFKQAALLAQDHRHPSLRALPLEGLPGYYRVRVATDVRLLYRRPERQNTIEILSLIDREDLDRYIKQAKTR